MAADGTQLAGKVALISGSARGQGATEARLFASHGAQVMISDILDAEGAAVAAGLGAAAFYVHLDTTSEEAWNAAVARTLERFGRLDILVNNAGIVASGGVESTSAEDYMRMVAVNQLGVFLGMKAALPALKRQGGAIVNISSLSGLHGSPNAIAYGATKWAVRGMTKSAAIEFAPYGIRVNSVHPSAVDTPMIAGLKSTSIDRMIDETPLGRIGTSDDVAELVLYLVSDASSYCTGAEFVIDGGRMAR